MSRRPSKKASKPKRFSKRDDEGKPKFYCHECQVKRGGRQPPGAVNTCPLGVCKGCGIPGVLTYECDYDWPDGRKAVWD